MNIFWFRRDLRLKDNRGLFEALTSGEDVLPIFIFDTNILLELPKDDARVSFIHTLLVEINDKLKQSGKSLAVFHGDPVVVIQQLVEKHKVKAVYINHDFEPYAREREKAIFELLNDKAIELKHYKDQVIFEKNEVVKDDGTPYVVYTPYMNKWREKLKTQELHHYDSASLINALVVHDYPFLSLHDIGFSLSGINVDPYGVASQMIGNYNETRNFPAVNGTSKISPYLRFGAISIREMVTLAIGSKDDTFLKELIWREFFMQILWHFPYTVSKSFRPKYDNIRWRNNEQEYKAWCEGETGYPLVDAGMRELNATGFMHNRVRLVVASFLCKHLLIDWRWGEAYFALKLLDYEQASNVGNWQWAAGSGVDAAPYFRIFNPAEQAKKFDKALKYISKWVPEFQALDYLPIVDHKEARERALRVYKEAVSQP